MSSEGRPVTILSTRDCYEALALDLAERARAAHAAGRAFSLALSGGSTARDFFRYVRSGPGNQIPWRSISLFQVDERLVPQDHDRSNFGMLRRELLSYAPVRAEQQFPMDTSRRAAEAAVAYAELLQNNLPSVSGVPVLDMVILGMGSDGHTASLFPGTADADRQELVLAAVQPESGEERISLGLPVLNAATGVRFLVTGADKSQTLAQLFDETGFQNGADSLPAGKIRPRSGNLLWYVDEAAGSLLPPSPFD